jgi:HEAT repeat protein
MKVLDEKSNPTRNELRKYLYEEGRKDKDVFGLGGSALMIAENNMDMGYIIEVAKDKTLTTSLRGTAIECLSEHRVREAVPVLEELMNGNEKEIGMRAAQALSQIIGKKYEWRSK